MASDGRGINYGNLPPLPEYKGIDIDKIARGNNKQRSGPDYLPHNKRGRDLYGRLTFNTGVMWLGGFTSGTFYGFATGWKNAASPNYKIRFNSVMNAVAKHGSTWGSSLAVIAFMHTSCVGAADAFDLENITGSVWATPAIAGLVTGAVYKSGRGPRAAALAGAIGTVASVAYTMGGSYIYNVVLGGSGRY